jgi:aspartokinase-like uncharacterized kinase
MKRDINAIIKIGGSVFANCRDSIQPLFKTISALGRNFRLVVTPGGGSFADEVRRVYKELNLSESTAHWMAILAINQMAFMINEFLEGSRVVFDVSDARRVTKGHRVPILAPFRLMFNRDPLPHTWDVTSDSIAAYIAKSMGARLLILVKDVDGIYTDDPKRVKDANLIERTTTSELIQNTNKPTCVDKMLPKVLKNTRVRTRIVNGSFPPRLESILKGEATWGTVIVPT